LFPWIDTVGVETVEKFNQKRETEILSTNKNIEEWIDKKAEEANTDGTKWIDKTAQTMGKKGEQFIKEAARSIEKNGANRIDEAVQATKKASEEYIEATAAQAYTRGYTFGYKNTIKAAPWIVGGAVVGIATYLCIKKKIELTSH